jgi:hypothetical protein
MGNWQCFNVEGGIKMHFSGSVENENLLYRTDSLQFFGDHSTVTVGPDVWVEPTPQLLNEEMSNWAKAANVMPSTIPTYWMSKKNIISDGASPRPGENIVHSLHGGAYIRLSASPHDLPAKIGRGLLEHCVDGWMSRILDRV